MGTTWVMLGAGRIERRETLRNEAPAPDWVRVAVAGCGVCHTDLGFLYDGVPTKKPTPLVLGHEISGVVMAAGTGAERWIGRRVIVPAVIHCGTCAPCRAGRPTSCRASIMPGNDFDGGFASEVDVPTRGLCDVDSGLPATGPFGKAGLELWELSVVADAVTTPLQAIRRAGLAKGELAVFVGAGGVGTMGLQIAQAFDAVTVAIDVSPARRQRALALGAAAALDAAQKPREIKDALRALAKARGLADWGWRIFETSGNPKGQELAFELIPASGSISIVGYSKERVSIALSKLMALDATAYGNWGADTALLPEALGLLASGQVQVRGLLKKFPMAETAAVLEAVHRGEIAERAVLVPKQV